ncbi:DUF5431 family protein [Pantoea agglomerans]
MSHTFNLYLADAKIAVRNPLPGQPARGGCFDGLRIW